MKNLKIDVIVIDHHLSELKLPNVFQLLIQIELMIIVIIIN